VYNPETEQLESLCKCMSGFTDTVYKEMLASFAPRLIPRAKAYYAVDEQLTPSVWFDADRVWEVRGADLTLSPKHSAARGLVDEARGISLRFPRFIRVREDKGVEEATTSQQIAELFRMQTRGGGGASKRGKR
jgi:DNA ligase-1